MPTNRRPRMRPRHVVDLSSSLRHYFLVGTTRDRLAPVRLPGWLRTMQLACDPVGFTAAWREHRAALTQEARAAGFEPAAGRWFDDDGRLYHEDFNDVRPDDDPARATWSDRFCSDHGY